MGSPGRCACDEPCRRDGCGSAGHIAQLGPGRFVTGQVRPGNLGLAVSIAAGRTACVGRSTRRAWKSRSARRSHVGCAPGCRGAPRTRATGCSNLGRAAARSTAPASRTGSTACDAGATSSSAGSAQLGCNRRATCTRLGRASARGASGAGASASSAGLAAATRRRVFAAGANLGIAARRGSAASGAGSAFVGRCAAGRSSARSARDRLGNGHASLEHSAREPAGAVLE